MEKAIREHAAHHRLRSKWLVVVRGREDILVEEVVAQINLVVNIRLRLRLRVIFRPFLLHCELLHALFRPRVGGNRLAVSRHL